LLPPAIALAAAAGQAASGDPAATPAAPVAASVEAGAATDGEALGGKALVVEAVRLTAAGYYIDLRYRVLDPELAQKSLGVGVKPKLIDEASGTVMAVPSTAKLGSLRQTQNAQKPNHLYFVMFINSAGLKSGSTVTAELGPLVFKHLRIQ
jgi:hypothetical protein